MNLSSHRQLEIHATQGHQTLSSELVKSWADAVCLYPMGLPDKDAITAFVKVLKKTVNTMARKGAPAIPELEKIGVKRLSPGPM